MQLAILLRKWRAVYELSAKTVAEQIGIKESSLSKFERGGTIKGEELALILSWALLKVEGESN